MEDAALALAATMDDDDTLDQDNDDTNDGDTVGPLPTAAELGAPKKWQPLKPLSPGTLHTRTYIHPSDTHRDALID